MKTAQLVQHGEEIKAMEHISEEVTYKLNKIHITFKAFTGIPPIKNCIPLPYNGNAAKLEGKCSPESAATDTIMATFKKDVAPVFVIGSSYVEDEETFKNVTKNLFRAVKKECQRNKQPIANIVFQFATAPDSLAAVAHYYNISLIARRAKAVQIDRDGNVIPSAPSKPSYGNKSKAAQLRDAKKNGYHK